MAPVSYSSKDLFPPGRLFWAGAEVVYIGEPPVLSPMRVSEEGFHAFAHSYVKQMNLHSCGLSNRCIFIW